MMRQAVLVLVFSLILGLNLAVADEFEHDEDERIGAVAYANQGWPKNQNLMNVQPGLPPISPFRPLQPQQPAALPAIGDAMRCYACSDCPIIQFNTPSRIIPQTFDPNRRHKCVVYTEKYNNVANALVFRGSAAERGTCEEIRKSHQQHNNFVSLVSCDECLGDLCNTSNAGHSISDLTLATFFIIIAPLLAKRVLS